MPYLYKGSLISDSFFTLAQMSKKEIWIDHGSEGRSENPGVPVLYGRHNLLSLVEIGHTVILPD